MSEALAMEGPEVPETVARDGVTGGALLRQAREASGLHIAALAVSLKIPVRKLEALEQDRYEQLTDAVFIRALASSVCRALKIDPRPVLERLPQTATPKLLDGAERINTPFRAPGDGAPPTVLQQIARPVPLAVLALLLGAMAMLFVPAFHREGSTEAASAPAAAPAVPAETVLRPPLKSVPEAGPASTPEVRSLVAETPPGVMPVSMEAAPVMPSGAAGPAPGASAPTMAPSDPAALTGNIVLFCAREPSWVEVTDAKGVVAVRRLLAAGESAGAGGTTPLQVTVGRADATDVQVRGRPMDLGSVARDNVARFEIK